MDYDFYLNKFHLAITEGVKEQLENYRLKVSVDIVLESAALKVYKPEWSSDLRSPLDAEGRIFFSIWINNETIREGKMYYNIHALQLRKFRKYTLASRKFAQDFRNEFVKYQKNWPNVSVEYGPLTLMQGWVELKTDSICENIEELVHHFSEISTIIDTVLEQYKK